MSSDASEPLGVLIIGRKRAGFDQDWNGIMVQRGIGALEEMGFRCVSGDVAVADDEAVRAAVDRIRSEGCRAAVVLQPSLGSGQLALTLAQEWREPVVLWATPERPESGTVSSCSLVAQHLWGSILRQAKHPFELVYGDPGSVSVRADLERAIRVCRAVTKLGHAKLGLVGGHPPGFLPMAADGFLMKRAIGAQLHTLSLPQFFTRARAISVEQVRRDVEQVRAIGLPMNEVGIDDLATNSRFYLAMRELIAEELLDALAVQCWPEFADLEGQWPYLAFSRLADEAFPVALEGDVDGALTALVGSLLGTGPAFIADWLEHDGHTIHFWHPGIAPLGMCHPIGSVNGPSLARHFNIKKPLVVDGALKIDQPVTVARFWRCDGEYRTTAFEGRSVQPQRRTPGNAALVETQEVAAHLLDDMLHEGLPHHVLMFFGHHAEAFRRTARMLHIRWCA